MLRNKKGFVVEGVVIVAVGMTLLCAILWKPLSGTLTSFIGSAQPQKVQKSYYKKTESAPMYYLDKDGTLIPAKTPYTRMEESSQAFSEESKPSLWQKIKNLGVLGIVLVVAGCAYPPLGGILIFVWKRVTKGLKTTINNANNQIQQIHKEQEALEGDARLIVKSVDEGLAAINSSIAAAQSTVDVSQKTLTTASQLSNAEARAAAIANAQTSLVNAQAVLEAVTNVKKEFLSAMSRKQDTTTKLLVAELKND